MSQVFRDEYHICTLEVGKTRESEISAELRLWVKGKPLGWVVEDGDGLTRHYYTNEERKAVICVGCRQGRVEHLRLKLGFWGPLAELGEVPEEAVTGCFLECLGTGHGVHMDHDGHGRERILECYGPPAEETVGGSTRVLGYRWPWGPLPRALRFTLEKDRVVEILLEVVPAEESPRLRPLAPARPGPPRKVLPLSERLQRMMDDGERELAEGRPQEAERLFAEVLEVLDEDPFPSFVKAHVMSRRGLARAHAGRGREGVEEVGICLRYLQEWNPADSPEVLGVRFTLGQARRRAGQAQGARKDLERLWQDLQASHQYHLPEVQDLVHGTAAELAELGVARYRDEIERALGGG